MIPLCHTRVSHRFRDCYEPVISRREFGAHGEVTLLLYGAVICNGLQREKLGSGCCDCGFIRDQILRLRTQNGEYCGGSELMADR